MPLNEKELGIAKAVVHQFLTSKEAMQRRPLHTQFKSAETLERLVRWSVLRSHDGFQTFFPAVLAFHYCGGEIELRARQSVEALAYVLKNLYEVELSRLNFKTEEIIAHAKKMYNGDGTTGA